MANEKAPLVAGQHEQEHGQRAACNFNDLPIGFNFLNFPKSVQSQDPAAADAAL